MRLLFVVGRVCDGGIGSEINDTQLAASFHIVKMMIYRWDAVDNVKITDTAYTQMLFLSHTNAHQNVAQASNSI